MKKLATADSASRTVSRFQKHSKESQWSAVLSDNLLDILVMLLGTLRLLGGGEMDGSFSSRGRLDEDIVML